jgi:hypothetical protein
MVAPAGQPQRVLHYQAALVRDGDGFTARCLELGRLCAADGAACEPGGAGGGPLLMASSLWPGASGLRRRWATVTATMRTDLRRPTATVSVVLTVTLLLLCLASPSGVVGTGPTRRPQLRLAGVPGGQEAVLRDLTASRPFLSFRRGDHRRAALAALGQAHGGGALGALARLVTSVLSGRAGQALPAGPRAPPAR